MAAPSNKKVKGTAVDRGGTNDRAELAEVRNQLNNVIASLRILATKMDADAGITDTNYFALTCDTALGATAPTQIDAL